MTKPELSTFSPVLLPVVQEYERYLPTAFDDSMTHLQKLNKVINTLGEIGKISNDIVVQWNTVMEWVSNDGLNETSMTTIQNLIDDGTFNTLINDGLLSEVKQGLGAKASQSDLTSLQTQVSSIVANSTTTEGNTELLDGRIVSTGKTYATLGERLRLNDDFESYTRSIATEYSTVLPLFAENAYIDKNTLVKTSHSGYSLTPPYLCNYNDEFLVTTYLTGPLVGTAVLYDENMVVLSVIGAFGNNTTDPQTSLIRVDKKLAKFIAFQVNASLRPSMLIRKKKPKGESIETLKRTQGYYRAKAKPRTGMSDRAQIWLTYDIGENQIVKPFDIPFKIENNVNGLSYRLFGGLTTSTYEATIESYGTFIGEGVYNYLGTGREIPMPIDPTSTTPTRYLQLFLDIILTNTATEGEIVIPKFKINGKEPVRAVLNLGSNTDQYADVAPFAERSPLYKKKIVGIGDSLLYGSAGGNEITWFNKLGKKYDMDYFNYGDNGDPIAETGEVGNVGMVNRFESMEADANYIVLLGGANDRRLNVPLGTNDSADKTTFKGALNVIIDGLIEKYPKGKILFMTNYNRFPSSTNSLGYSDIEYVDAMLELCAYRGIQCFDNYRNSGINFQHPTLKEWMDEGIADVDGVANVHISKEAYDWLLPKYEKLIESL